MSKERGAEKKIKNIESIEELQVIAQKGFESGNVGKRAEHQQEGEYHNKDDPRAAMEEHLAKSDVEVAAKFGKMRTKLSVDGLEVEILTATFPELDATQVGQRPQVKRDE